MGYDDVLVFAPVAAVIEQGDRILGYTCLNFLAGPTLHPVDARSTSTTCTTPHTPGGTSGGNTQT